MNSLIPTDPAPTLEDVWRLFRETDRIIKENAQAAEQRAKQLAKEAEQRSKDAEQRAKQFAKEVEQRAEQRAKDAEQRSIELDRIIKENDRIIKENAQQLKETERLFKQQSIQLNKKIGDLGNRLGEFVEGLIKPSVVRLFQSRGIDVHAVMRDIEMNNPQLNLAMQIDLLVVNNGSCVLVEVKSNLSIDDVNEHLERMEKFKTLFPVYKDYKVFGAVAGMVLAENVSRYAYKKGFFVIAQQGELAVILNDDKFQPVAW